MHVDVSQPTIICWPYMGNVMSADSKKGIGLTPFGLFFNEASHVYNIVFLPKFYLMNDLLSVFISHNWKFHG